MSLSKIELSIIIISYNTAPITVNCINSIFNSFKKTDIFEVIIIDNASTDNTLEELKKLQKTYQNVRIIGNSENIGFARANNQAVKLAQGKYLLFLNSDILVLDDAIEKLLDFYKLNEKSINFLGGKLLNKDLSPQPSCGPFYSLPVIFAALFLRGDYWGLTRYSPNIKKSVDWISGACILTTKHQFDRLGGFDENIFMYMDEIDLLYRAKKMGATVFFYPKSRFIHLGSASSAKRTYPILQVYKGFIYFYKKHYSLFDNKLLMFMLKLKALVAIVIGKISNNNYLIETYEKAYKMVQMD